MEHSVTVHPVIFPHVIVERSRIHKNNSAQKNKEYLQMQRAAQLFLFSTLLLMPEGLGYNSRVVQIRRCVANGSPPLRRFFAAGYPGAKLSAT